LKDFNEEKVTESEIGAEDKGKKQQYKNVT